MTARTSWISRDDTRLLARLKRGKGILSCPPGQPLFRVFLVCSFFCCLRSGMSALMIMTAPSSVMRL
jgi:hypothetical protein